jgi:erythromycin esterase-like protein
MLEFLVEEKGFRLFAIEASMPEALDINDYILTGRGDPAKALAGLYFWTWDTREVLDLIEWMRQYNADPSHERKAAIDDVTLASVGASAKLGAPLRGITLGILAIGGIGLALFGWRQRNGGRGQRRALPCP